MSVLFPLRAREVMTGSLNAVPKTGVSHHRGDERRGQQASSTMGLGSAGQSQDDAEPLSELDFAFFFYPGGSGRPTGSTRNTSP